MAQQQEHCGAAFDLDGLTLRWYTHRGAAHQVGPSLRELECITDLAHLLLEAGETAFTQRVVAVGIHATSILEAGLARTAVETPMREGVLVTRGVIPCRAVHEASVGNKLPQGADRSGHTSCLPRADDATVGE